MSKVFEELLRVRGLEAGFLSPKYEDSVDPWVLPDMKKAVERIQRAVSRGEKVLIYGDYDVDGVTASTVLYDTLRLAGVSPENLEIMLPNRFTDGYGMSKKVVQRAKETGVGLVMTVDCGSRNHEIIEELKEAEIEVIVTDHHECDERLPEAVAVVNPKRKDALELALEGVESAQERRELEKAVGELRELAGVGVAFKVAQALVLEGMIPAGQEKWLLDLVLIGTVCDSMVLRGENRRLCFYGLKVLEKTRRPGLRELMREAAVKRLDTEAIGFQIGPRLNAAGRMETAEKALGVLMTAKKTEAARLVMELEELNRRRKSEQQGAVQEIMKRGVGDEPVIVEEGEWHEGVLGIIAGRLVEEFRRPAFVLTEVDGTLKGSGRSFGEFSLAEALERCREHIIGGGGHAGACGVKVEKAKFEDFKRAVNEYYRSLELEDQMRFLGVREDLEVREFGELTLELVEELRKLEPYGEGNQEPVFLLPEVKVVEVARLGADKTHLRLTVWDQNGKSLKLMKFFAAAEELNVREGGVANIWINLHENEFRGIRSVEGRILKIQEA